MAGSNTTSASFKRAILASWQSIIRVGVSSVIVAPDISVTTLASNPVPWTEAILDTCPRSMSSWSTVYVPV